MAESKHLIQFALLILTVCFLDAIDAECDRLKYCTMNHKCNYNKGTIVTFPGSCTKLRCDGEPGGYKHWKNHQHGCKTTDGKCVYHGETTMHGCNTLRCHVEERTDRFRTSFSYDKVMCSYKGRCIDEGASFDEGCNTMRCHVEKRPGKFTTYIRYDKARCSYKGQCIDNGTSVDEGCNTMRCHVAKRPGKFTTSIRYDKARCSYKGQCIDHGASVDEGCKSVRCQAKIINNRMTYEMQVLQKKCADHKGN